MDYRCLFLLILSWLLPDAEPGQVVVATVFLSLLRVV